MDVTKFKRFTKKIFKTESIQVAIITAIVTAILTTLGNHWIMKRNIDLVRLDKQIDKQHQLLEEFTKTSEEFELLREQAYDNKFLAIFQYKSNELTKTYNNDSLINYSIEAEGEIRFNYNQKLAELNALLIIIPEYFNTINEKQLVECKKYIAEGFQFNSDYMEKTYDELFSTSKNNNKFFDELNEKMKKKYNYNFYKEALSIINEMKKEIK